MKIKEQFALEALDIIKTTKEGVLKGIEVVQDEIPDIIQQLLLFKLFEHLFYIVFILILTFIYLKVSKIAFKHNKDWGEMCYVFGGLLVMFPIIVVPILSIITILKITIAPKIYLIEYLSSLIS